jgi:hypothetical protein
VKDAHTGRSEPQSPTRLPRLLALVLLGIVLTFAACGGEDSDGGGSAGSEAAGEGQQANPRDEAGEGQRAGSRDEAEQGREEPPEEQRDAAAPSEEEEQAEQSATRFFEALGAEEAGAGEDGAGKRKIDSAAFCELTGETAREQTIRYAEVSSGFAREWDCESAVEFLASRSRRSGGLDRLRTAKVIGVNVEGDRATATLRFDDGPVTSIPLVREDGEWKIGASPPVVGAGVGREQGEN